VKTNAAYQHDELPFGPFPNGACMTLVSSGDTKVRTTDVDPTGWF
jgi:hypothetical protein